MVVVWGMMLGGGGGGVLCCSVYCLLPRPTHPHIPGAVFATAASDVTAAMQKSFIDQVKVVMVWVVDVGLS